MLQRIINFFISPDAKVSRALKVFTNAREMLSEAIENYQQQISRNEGRVGELKEEIKSVVSDIHSTEEKIAEAKKMQSKITEFLG